MLGVNPAVGLLTETIVTENLLKSHSSGSPYLSLCEEPPEEFLHLRKFVPFVETDFEDPYFRAYCLSNPGLVPGPEFRWDHSSMSEKAVCKAVAKFCVRRPDIRMDPDWELAEVWLLQILQEIMPCSRVLPLTRILAEAVLTTASGPQHRSKFATKADFFDSHFGRDFFTRFWNALGSPGSELCLFGAHLKAELRLAMKVLEHATRLFLIAPSEHHAALAMMSKDFNDKLIAAASSRSCPIAIGMDVYNGGFDLLGTSLAAHNTRWFADISGYDTRQMLFLQSINIRVRFLMLAPEDQTFENLCRLCNLYRDIIYTPVMLPDGLVVFLQGNPSGQFNTGMDNTITLLYVFLYSYLTSGAPRSLTAFKKLTFMKLAGDDSAAASSDPRFNPEHFASTCRMLGWGIEFSDVWEFLGHFISWSPSLNVYVPVFPYHKALASLVLSGHPSSDALVSKAMSVRVLVYTNRLAFPVVDRYCQWLLGQFPHRSDYRKMYLSEPAIQALIAGRMKRPGFFCLERLDSSRGVKLALKSNKDSYGIASGQQQHSSTSEFKEQGRSQEEGSSGLCSRFLCPTEERGGATGSVQIGVQGPPGLGSANS